MRRSILAIASALALVVAGASAASAVEKHDFFEAADIVGALPFVDATDTVGATLQSEEPRPCGSIGATVWYRLTPVADATVAADTNGSNFDTVLAAYSGDALASLQPLACNDDAGGSIRSKISFKVKAGTTYFVQAGGFGGATGFLHLRLGPTGSLAGTVTGWDGDDLADVCVRVYDAAQRRIATAYTNDAGAYVVNGLPGGEVKVHFEDCAWYGPYEPARFAAEWWDDKRTFAAADPVTIFEGAATTGIDAVLDPSPTPDGAITSIEITPVPLQTIAGDAPVQPGFVRDVTVGIANVGTRRSSGYLRIDVCPRSTGSCYPLARKWLSLSPGASISKTYRWNGNGHVGDFSVAASYRDYRDANEHNDVMEKDQFFLVSGTGYGVSPRPMGGRYVCLPYAPCVRIP